jgi:hypothetical protein
MAFQRITPAKLAQAAVTAGTTTIYTVPASTRTMIKEMDICNTTAGTLTLNVHLVPSGGSATTANALFYNASISANTTLQWSGVQVLNVGDTIRVQGSGLGLTINISGGEAT